MNHVLCDGGLCNRLNALIFALILKRKFGHAWSISWPTNNWCGAPFEDLFTAALPVDRRSIEDYKHDQDRHLLLMHENQIGFAADRLVINTTLASYDDYRRHLDGGHSVVYFNNLLPPFVEPGDVRDALALLAPAAHVAAAAAGFIAQHAVDARTVGLHIRKTDFGNRVDDDALFAQAMASPGRFFVCSDDATVNRRFALLANCAVFRKTAFPEKLEPDAAWQHWTTDAEGRRFPFNITRSATSVVEALIDLLVLSQTGIVPTSGSTFLATAQLFRSCRFFVPAAAAMATAAPVAALVAAPVAAPIAAPIAAPVAAVSKADVERLLELLQPRPLASDLLVRGGDGDAGWSLPAAALNSALVVAFGPHLGLDPGPDAGPDSAPDLPHQLAARGARLQRCESRLDAGSAAAGPASTGGHQLLHLAAGGAEWAALAGADAALIDRFDTVVGSLHDLASVVNRDFFDRAEAVLTRLAATHQVVHLAARASGGVVSLGQQPFPCVLDVTWVRKRGAQFGAAAPEPVFDQLVQAATPRADQRAEQRAEQRHGFALFPTLRQLRMDPPRGVLQVGASYGQEMREFLEGGIRTGVFIEPLPEPFQHLAGVCSQLPNFIPVQALCADRAGRQHDFHVASNGGMSSSILKPANHLLVNDYVSFPTTVSLTSTTLDDVMAKLVADGHGAVAASLDLLFMDTQGAEFQILLGATRTLRQFKYLYFEVMRNDMYEGQTPFLTYCHYLEAVGFTLNDVYFNHPEQTGNALFIRQDLVAVGT